MPNRELVFYLNPTGPDRRKIMRLLAEAGIRRIGIDGCPWKPGQADREIAAFHKDLKEFGLTVYSMHAIPCLVATAGPDAPQDLMDSLLADLRRLAAMGGKTAVYHACMMRNVVPEKVDEAIAEVGWDVFVKRYAIMVKFVAQEAAKHDITVVLENIWQSEHSRSVKGFLPIVEAAAEPNVGVILDSGHAHLCGLSIADEIRAAGKHLRDTHFHDNIGLIDGQFIDQHIPPGLGTINWQAACKALNEIAFPGPIVFEGVLGPGDSIEKGRFGGKLSHKDLIAITIANWRAFEAMGEKA
ncbi:MAG: sugar phosphate isomerase/epimerase family protein [Planctomycetota bacterium]